MPRDVDKVDPPSPPSAPLWSAPLGIDEIPETGSHIELTADAAVRAAIAKAAGLNSLPSLQATFDVARRARGVAVTGQVEATVGQTCVVTLEPIESHVAEAVDLVFAPPSDPAFAGEDPPEPLTGDSIDLGAIAVEFLMLGIDPYPRKKGAEFVSPNAPDPKTNPFSALESLKKGPPSRS
jgi:uncharacterized metal-binding protein YceD (DUF177 family)